VASKPRPDDSELVETLRGAQVHLARYVTGSAKDANGEFAAAELLIDSVIARLESDTDDPERD
jgi:hypothetical protein